MSGPAMVRPASSDFWKAPLERGNTKNDPEKSANVAKVTRTFLPNSKHR